jgi:hypothetical protein
MSDTIPVIYESAALDDAENLARSEYSDIPLVALEADEFHVRTDSAHYANGIAPELRRISGYGDATFGTYQEEREIALIPVGHADDQPADAILMSSRTLGKKVHDTYREEAYRCYQRQRKEAGIDES